MSRTHQIAPAIFTGPDQVPGRFLLDTGNCYLHDLAQMQQPGQMPSVAGIGLDPIPRRALQLRGCRHRTLDPRPQQEPRKPEPGRAGLIDRRYRARQRPDPLQDLSVIRRQPALKHLPGLPIQPARHH